MNDYLTGLVDWEAGISDRDKKTFMVRLEFNDAQTVKKWALRLLELPAKPSPTADDETGQKPNG
jgi:hypothetical protein